MPPSFDYHPWTELESQDGDSGAFTIDFNSPMSVGPATLGEKGPLEFTISPAAGKLGVEFVDIKGARVGIGRLKTDLKMASLSFKDGEPKLTLNNTITLPLSGLAKLIGK